MVITEWQFHETDFIPVVGRDVGDGFIESTICVEGKPLRAPTTIYLCYQETSERLMSVRSKPDGTFRFPFIPQQPLYYLYAHYMWDRVGEPLPSTVEFTREPQYQGAFADFIVAERYALTFDTD